MNNTNCLTTTLLVTRVVVGGWKTSLVDKLALSQQGEGCSNIMINRARAEQSLTRG